LVGIVIGSILVVLFFGFPYALMFITSLKTRLEVTDIPPVYFPEEPRWQNYIDVWSSSVNPASSLLSTTVIALRATLLVLLVATPAAYYIARFRFPGHMVFLLLVLCTQMLQPTVLAVGLFQEFKGWS